MNKFLVVVVGPTAVGKTSVAIQLAQHFKAEIVSADARQVFREMRIGTAKPTHEEMQLAKHHLVDSHSVHEHLDAATFAVQAMAILNKIFETRSAAILCGGSGLYIKALLEGFDEMPEVQTTVREELNSIFKEQGIERLQLELKVADPDYYEIVDKQNPQRLIRALEVFRSSGKTYSSYRSQRKSQLPFSVIKIGLTLPREVLYHRINERMDKMIAAGLFEEAETLHSLKHLNALQTVGYSEIFDFLDGKYSKEEAIRLLKQNSRNYAKRQLTWFNKDKEIKWFTPNDFAEMVKYIEEKSTNLRP